MNKEMDIKMFIDFNDISTHLGLFYVYVYIFWYSHLSFFAHSYDIK